ncbi:MAG: L,D-transpeptidase [Candidatus Levybacteria bacterium]|nr:L,D-transpeptidase [Candidatus Levybacteria bacterium]
MKKKNRKKSSAVSIYYLMRKEVIASLFFAFIGSIGLFVYLSNTLPLTRPCANTISCIEDLNGEYEKNAAVGEFMGKQISVPRYMAMIDPLPSVLGDTTATKKIYVDLTNQKLYAREGNTIVYEFPVSTGKWYPTPTGVFTIWAKLRYTKMEGGNKATNTYYYLPNVPNTMFFYNNDIVKSRGFGIHGAYWHNNFGHPMSHGCINMAIEDSGKLFAWAAPALTTSSGYATTDNPGTEVIIYGTTPAE